MPRFVRAFHKQDADGMQQTIGLAGDGQVWLQVTGQAGDPGSGIAAARFTPEDALRFAAELARLGRYGAAMQGAPVAVHEPGDCWCGTVHDVAGSLARNLVRQHPGTPVTDVAPCEGCGTLVAHMPGDKPLCQGCESAEMSGAREDDMQRERDEARSVVREMCDHWERIGTTREEDELIQQWRERARLEDGQ